MNIEEFVNKDYKDYAREVVFKRAIPYFIDGFKDGARKIFYYLKHKPNKLIKVSAIAGGIIEQCDYHHAETSAQDTVVKLARFYEGSNNLPIAIPDGNFGSKKIRTSASARYIFAKYNNLMDFIFLDNELTIKNSNLETVEPEYYYPIIPLNIVNGISGIAIGYAVNVIGHNPYDIIDYMIDVLKSGRSKITVNPLFHGCDYKIEKVEDLKYTVKSNGVSIKNKLITITELTPKLDRESFTKILIELEEKGIIKSFSDESKEDYKFVIKNLKLTEENLYNHLQLECNLSQNLNFISDSTVLSFNSIEEYITEFLNRRLSVYSERKSYMKTYHTQKKHENGALICFINNKNVLVKSRNEIIEFFLNKGLTNENISKCLSKPISALSIESVERLKNEIKEHEEKINYYDKVDEKELYLNDLKLLKKEVVKFYKEHEIKI